jgi:hypothetical protein
MTLLGALLAALTAAELRKTSTPLVFRTAPSTLSLPWWTDEGATIVSCGCYVLGNIVFIAGSVMFFPRVLLSGGDPVRVTAVVLFVFGSFLFLGGAAIDLLVVLRAGTMEQDASAARANDGRSAQNAYIWKTITQHGQQGAQADGATASPTHRSPAPPPPHSDAAGPAVEMSGSPSPARASSGGQGDAGVPITLEVHGGRTSRSAASLAAQDAAASIHEGSMRMEDSVVSSLSPRSPRSERL